MLSIPGLFLLLSMLCPKPACCAGHYVSVGLPANITANAVFVIHFTENDFQLKKDDQLSKFSFIAVGNKGARVKLINNGINFSGSYGQIILKPETDLPLHDSISLELSYTGSYGENETNIKLFITNLSWRKWKVTRLADYSAPKWNCKTIPFEIQDGRNSSVGGCGISFTMPVTDNSFKELGVKEYGEMNYPVLYEIKVGDQKFINYSWLFKAGLHRNVCGNNYDFQMDKEYTVTIRPMDISGNFGEARTKTFTITFPPNPPVRKIN